MTWVNMMTGQLYEGDCLPGDRSANESELATGKWSEYQKLARSALDASDTTMHRITEAVALGLTTLATADVVAFCTWRRALRAILSEAQPATIPTDLPTKPVYPANT